VKRAFLSGGAVILSALLVVSGASAAVIENIQGTLQSSVELYYGDGDYFQTNHANGGLSPAQISVLALSLLGEGAPSYYMYYGDFAMTPSALVSDDTASNGGLALGTFASGATLTITGDLFRDFGDYGLAASGDLIVADVMFDWELEEQVSPPYPSNTLLAQVHFDITGGALSNAGLNADGLVLGDFYLDLTFERCTPVVTDFTTLLGDQVYSTSTAKVQGGAVPEPCTIMLIGLGSLAVARRRKK
jgi:hypothetical protein